MKNQIIVQDQTITIIKDDYICLTDIARSKNSDEPKDVVKNWLRNKNTIAFLGLWEKINNPNFKGVEFDSFLNEAGFNSFTLSPTKWCEKTSAIGIFTKLGKNGGTYATAEQLVVLANLESLNAEFIKSKMEAEDRLLKLNQIAIEQLQLLLNKKKKKAEKLI